MLISDLFKDSVLAAHYLREGYVLIPLLTTDDISAMNSLFSTQKKASGVDRGFYTSVWSDNEHYRKEVDQGLKKIMMPRLYEHFTDIKSVFANYMVKASGPDTSLISHQDWSFVEEPLYDTATVWCPLVDVNAHNGNLQIIARSHRINNFVRGRFFDAPFRHISDTELQRYLTHVSMRAGEALIFNSRLIHASPPNMSGTTRVAASVVISPTAAPLYHWTLDSENNPTASRRLHITNDFFWEHSCYEPLDGLQGDNEQPYVKGHIREEELAGLLRD
jgi:hypothetical protein